MSRQGIRRLVVSFMVLRRIMCRVLHSSRIGRWGVGLSYPGREFGAFQCWWDSGPGEPGLPLMAGHLGIDYCGFVSFRFLSVCLRTSKSFLVDSRERRMGFLDMDESFDSFGLVVLVGVW